MKNYKVEITRNFIDSVENVERKLGEESAIFLCTKERYEFLNSKNAVELVNVIEEVIKEEDSKKKSKKNK